MKNELMMAINQICSERNLPSEVIIEAIETALVSAYKKNYGGSQSIKATLDMKTGTSSVFIERIVVDEVRDERFEISLSQARKIQPDAKPGALIQVDITPSEFGRIAAQAAKQVILQRIREAERDVLFSSYADREGELITGIIASITPYGITLNLGRTEGIMPRNQQVHGERYKIGQRVRVYVVEVRRTSRGPQIVVSRSHRNMLRRLLELEVPEIFNGTVEIKAVAREAGSRSKVAVAALQEGVDPVGSCVGIRGMRIQSIVNELGGEKIDVVEWSPDVNMFIANALSPAKVNYTVLSDQHNNKTATVVVPDDQLSLAIGKEGQNARLAAKLTGWRIDIKSLSEVSTEELRPSVRAGGVPGQRDILAMAEAILLGKEPTKRVETKLHVEAAQAKEAETAQAEAVEIETAQAEAAKGETVGVEAAQELAEPQTAREKAEPETVQKEAEPEAVQKEAEPEPAAVAAPEQETPTPGMAEAVAEDQEPQERAKAEIETEATGATSQPRSQRPGAGRPRQPRYEYVADEEMEMAKSPKKTRRQQKQLVLDEESGALVVKRKHKQRGGADEREWEDTDY